MMQFGISRLLIVVTLIAILCGLIFAAPPVFGMPLLALFLACSPAVWIAGIAYARGASQAFFIGGTVSGIAPWTATFYWYSIMSVQAMSSFISSSGIDPDFWKPPIQSNNYLANLLVIAPGVVSLAGGLLSVAVFRMLKANPSVSARVIER